VVGTHTHIPTADERVLPGGTGLLTDVGCTGVVDSVIGMHTKTAIDRFLLQIPQRYQLATGKMQLCGVLVDIDPQTGNCKRIARVLLKEDELLTPVVYSAAKTAEETD
jgi:2',3'-cyclic-nucleotide 2'-phosphodiesterase